MGTSKSVHNEHKVKPRRASDITKLCIAGYTKKQKHKILTSIFDEKINSLKIKEVIFYGVSAITRR